MQIARFVLFEVNEKMRERCAATKSARTNAHHIPNTKLSCFVSTSCDDDGPVGQTGSEAAQKPENVATMAQPS